jgi:hypothetical protein
MSKFALVGSRPSNACQEKTITFKGTQLLHMVAILEGKNGREERIFPTKTNN